MSVSPYGMIPKSRTPWLNSWALISCPYLYSWNILEGQKNSHRTLFTAAYQRLSRNWALVTDFQRQDTSTSLIFLGGSGYLWDRLSFFRSDLRVGQRRLLQQTHHWSRKNWQHWLCTMCCQLKTTGWRKKNRRINQNPSGSPTANNWRGMIYTLRKIRLCVSLQASHSVSHQSPTHNCYLPDPLGGTSQLHRSPKSCAVFDSDIKDRSLIEYCNFCSLLPFSLLLPFLTLIYYLK